jgi:dTDP-4-amino-4,6-dideoxygalactose transaminase
MRGSSPGTQGWWGHERPRPDVGRDVTDDPPIRIYLSPPDVGEDERALLLDAFDSGWIAPLGPHVDAFEEEVAAKVGAKYAVAVSSGTAALHLALILAGVEPGDRVLCSTLTFVASANPIVYVGAEPVFVDAEPRTWNLDVDLVEEELKAAAARGERYAALIAVDLYGRVCDFDRLVPLCQEYGVTLIEDAAEALGSSRGGRMAGTFGDFGVFSFNGNKILTSSGGGMLITEDAAVAERARHLATQARDPAPHYEHSEVGYNYRLSNLLAAVGRGQLRHLEVKASRRRAISARYREELGDLPGVAFPHVAEDNGWNGWLSCLVIDPKAAGVDREAVRRHLRSKGIEARPVWKPMHVQPVFAGAQAVDGGVAEEVFERGLCLPSGSSLTDEQQDEVSAGVDAALARALRS